MPTVSFVTIGQSPRSDLVSEIMTRLGDDFVAVQAGALDGLNLAQAEQLLPEGATDIVITKMRDGTSVKLSKAALVPRLQACFDSLDSHSDIHVLLCTGAYPKFATSKPLLEAEATLFQHARLQQPSKIGVMIPIEEQRTSTLIEWSSLASQVEVEFATPYEDTRPIAAAAARLLEKQVTAVAMSCLGYNVAMAEIVKHETGVPVLLPRLVLAEEIRMRLS